ncbi:MAG: S8 family serine peptidase [Actinomycetota bacterium]|nr:S8 family serine peptidase [Actinomycetota bacterium]
MRTTFRHLAPGLSVLVFLVVTGHASPASKRADRSWPRGVAVVGYGSPGALREALNRRPGRIVRRIPKLRVAEIKPAGDVRAFATALAAQPGITYVERLARRFDLAEPALLPAPYPGGTYEWQFGATREHQVPASVLRAASALKIAVLDTGGDLAAPDLAAKTPTTWNAVSGTSDVVDTYGHGTFVSSIAAGSVTNNEGLAGFGGDAKLLVVKIAQPDGSLSDLDAAAGLVYAADHGAKIVNMSFGGTTPSTTEQNAIDYAAAKGALLVAAAGNEAESGNPVEYPAAQLQPVGSNGQGGKGLAVGATNLYGARASFSNTGSYLSVAAPGENVFGAISSLSSPSMWPRTTLTSSSAGYYGFASGTSFASPAVAGAAALVWAANPTLPASEVSSILKETASGKGSWNQQLGYGMIDVAAAVARAQGAAPGGDAVALAGSRSGARVHLSWSAPGAISYRLSVSRDGEQARVLIGSTTDTKSDFTLMAGHKYVFTIAATDAFGAVKSSAPFTVSLAQAASSLKLDASRKLGRKLLRVRFTAVLFSASPAAGARARRLVLESYDGGAWRQFARATTRAKGHATWSLALRRGTYRIRARFPGAVELAPATSKALTIRVR